MEGSNRSSASNQQIGGPPADPTTQHPLPAAQPPQRLICNSCGQRFWLPAESERACSECGGDLRCFGPLEGLVDRFLGPSEQVDSPLYHRHVQMVELLWTRDNRGRHYYDIVKPKVGYGRFVKLVTELVCRGLEEGWAELVLPRTPVPDDRAYKLVFPDPDRFAQEMARLFEAKEPREN